MPVHRILAQIGSTCRFSVVDGAQAFNQRPVDIGKLQCDLFLTGTQKWFRSYHPLRIAFVGRQLNADSIRHCSLCPLIPDPLYQFCNSLTECYEPAYGETVNIAGLIAAAGALQEMNALPLSRRETHWQRLQGNVAALRSWLGNTSLSLSNLHHSLWSGITTLDFPQKDRRPDIRAGLAEHGIVASSLVDGYVRFSLPKFELSLNQMSRILRACHALT